MLHGTNNYRPHLPGCRDDCAGEVDPDILKALSGTSLPRGDQDTIDSDAGTRRSVEGSAEARGGGFRIKIVPPSPPSDKAVSVVVGGGVAIVILGLFICSTGSSIDSSSSRSSFR